MGFVQFIPSKDDCQLVTRRDDGRQMAVIETVFVLSCLTSFMELTEDMVLYSEFDLPRQAGIYLSHRSSVRHTAHPLRSMYHPCIFGGFGPCECSGSRIMKKPWCATGSMKRPRQCHDRGQPRTKAVGSKGRLFLFLDTSHCSKYDDLVIFHVIAWDFCGEF